MNTHAGPSDPFQFTVAGANVTGGQGLLLGSLFGVVVASALIGELAAMKRTGRFTLPKATGQVWSVGSLIYWDDTAKNATTTVGSNKVIGAAAAAAISGATSGEVLLTGQVS